METESSRVRNETTKHVLLVSLPNKIRTSWEDHDEVTFIQTKALLVLNPVWCLYTQQAP